jgi:hypothetical protein
MLHMYVYIMLILRKNIYYIRLKNINLLYVYILD